jgi:ribosomal protein L29
MSKLTTDLSRLSATELGQRVTELKAQLVEQKRARAAKELANSQAIKKTRREIAVALTLQASKKDVAAKKEEA